MALDTKRPYGTALGGLIHGFAVQDEKIYHPAGYEVKLDKDGKPVKVAGASAPVTKAPDKAPAAAVVNEQVAKNLAA